MVSPENYQAGYLDSLEQKLFILRDGDGKRNQEVSKVVRLMQREMGSQEAFIGIAPIGSSITGYGTREKHGEDNTHSDIDISVFYDSSVNPDAEAKLKQIFKGESPLARQKGAYTFPAHMPGGFRHDLNLDRITKAFSDPKHTSPEET